MTKSNATPLDGLDWMTGNTPPAMRDMGFISISDLAGRLDVRRQTIYSIIKRTGVNTARMGRRVYVDLADLERILKEGQARPTPRKGRPRKVD